MKVVAICACMALALACDAAAKERCIQRPGKHYEAGVAQALTARRIAHKLAPESGVCVSEEHAAELEAATLRVDQHFWEVAHYLRDACEERALVEWARREKLRFEVGDVVDLGRKPAGRMFHLRSYTAEEVSANRRKLEDAPKGASCGEGLYG